MEDTLDNLIARHRELVRDGAPDRALAEIEYMISKNAPEAIPRSGHHMIQWASKTLGQSQHSLSRRRELWIIGEAADVLWPRIEAGMPLGRAQRVLMAARSRASSRRNRAAFRRAVEDELRKLDFLPTESANSPPQVPLPQAQTAIPFPSPELAPREFWQRLRDVVSVHMRPRLEGVPEHERDRLMDDFDRDIQSVFAQHSAKWQKASRLLQEQRRIPRQRFVNALRALHMDPPRRGAPLEPVLVQANKQKRTLARLYHPDSHGGSEHTRDQYQAVLDAFLVVEQYVSENKKPVVPNLRVVNGGK